LKKYKETFDEIQDALKIEITEFSSNQLFFDQSGSVSRQGKKRKKLRQQMTNELQSVI